jgi:hypothetical protein
LEDAIEHCLTHLICRLLSRINVLHIITKGNSAENKGEDDSHKADVSELFDVDGNSFKDISNLGVIAKYVHDMKEE